MQDLRLAVRSLAATPIVTAVAVLSLALGIGANTAIFSLLNSVILRTLPVSNPQRLAILAGRRNSGARPHFSYATFDQIRRHGQAFDGALAFSNSGGTGVLTIGSEAVSVERLHVSGDFFDTLGLSPVVGRLFKPADDVSGGGPDGRVAVISYRLWRQRFGGSPGIIGVPMTYERAPITIVGVTPPDFFGVEVGRTFDMILPLKSDTTLADGAPWLNILVRVKPRIQGVSAPAARGPVVPQFVQAGVPPVPGATFLREP